MRPGLVVEEPHAGMSLEGEVTGQDHAGDSTLVQPQGPTHHASCCRYAECVMVRAGHHFVETIGLPARSESDERCDTFPRENRTLHNPELWTRSNLNTP